MPLFLSRFLNRITMHRLMLFLLVFLLATAFLESFLGILPYRPVDIFLTLLILLAVSSTVNTLFAKALSASARPESTLITALILALIVGPLNPMSNIPFLVAASVFAIASKYLFAVRKRHLFNPAAAGVLLTAFVMQRGASWWIGSIEMLPLLALGGVVLLAKIRRFTLAFTFLAVYLGFSALFGTSPAATLLYSPIVFFTTVMLIEPLTSPVEPRKQIAYASLVGFLLVLFQQTLKVGYTLELSLLAGNIFSSFTSPRFGPVLAFLRRREVAKNTPAGTLP